MCADRFGVTAMFRGITQSSVAVTLRTSVAKSFARTAKQRRSSEAGIAPVAVILAGVIGTGILTGWIWEPVKLIAEAFAPVADAVLDLLPDAEDLNLEIPSGFILGFSFLNTFLPLTEALAAIAGFVLIIVAGIGWRIAVTVYHLIPKPGVGT